MSERRSSADSASLRDALDNSQSLLVMIDLVGPDSASWIKEDMRDLLTKQIVENRTSLSDPKRTEPQTAGAESHSLAAMEGEKDTIVNLIHEHVGFEVLLAIESGVLTGVEKAAEAILAELGRRSQAVSASVREAELEEALRNLMGIYDTPVSRRRYRQDQFMKEALDIARAALTRPQRGEQ